MSRLPFEIPSRLGARTSWGEEGADWLERLPRLISDLAAEWQLTFDGPPMSGFVSLVVPVTSPFGPAALKVTWDGDDESLHEPIALQHWAGDGTVRLLRADPRRRALLLELLSTEDLGQLWDVQACEIIANFYRRIHVPALPQLRTVTSYLSRPNTALAALPRDAPIPRRLVEHAVSLCDDFLTDPASAGTLIHGDLHFGNVLAAQREPWLVIDPKPMSGDPHYEVAPLLWNRWDEMSHDLRDSIRRRFHTVVDTAGFDEERARDWVIVRAMHNAYWALSNPGAGDWITRMIAIAKAVQD